MVLTNVAQILTTIASGGPQGLKLIYAGRVVSGVGIGALSTVAPAFVSECCPKDVRGRITGFFQIMVSRPSTTLNHTINKNARLPSV